MGQRTLKDIIGQEEKRRGRGMTIRERRTYIASLWKQQTGKPPTAAEKADLFNEIDSLSARKGESIKAPQRPTSISASSYPQSSIAQYRGQPMRPALSPWGVWDRTVTAPGRGAAAMLIAGYDKNAGRIDGAKTWAQRTKALARDMNTSVSEYVFRNKPKETNAFGAGMRFVTGVAMDTATDPLIVAGLASGAARKVATSAASPVLRATATAVEAAGSPLGPISRSGGAAFRRIFPYAAESMERGKVVQRLVDTYHGHVGGMARDSEATATRLRSYIEGEAHKQTGGHASGRFGIPILADTETEEAARSIGRKFTALFHGPADASQREVQSTMSALEKNTAKLKRAGVRTGRQARFARAKVVAMRPVIARAEATSGKLAGKASDAGAALKYLEGELTGVQAKLGNLSEYTIGKRVGATAQADTDIAKVVTAHGDAQSTWEAARSKAVTARIKLRDAMTRRTFMNKRLDRDNVVNLEGTISRLRSEVAQLEAAEKGARSVYRSSLETLERTSKQVERSSPELAKDLQRLRSLSSDVSRFRGVVAATNDAAKVSEGTVAFGRKQLGLYSDKAEALKQGSEWYTQRAATVGSPEYIAQTEKTAVLAAKRQQQRIREDMFRDYEAQGLDTGVMRQMYREVQKAEAGTSGRLVAEGLQSPTDALFYQGTHLRRSYAPALAAKESEDPIRIAQIEARRQGPPGGQNLIGAAQQKRVLTDPVTRQEKGEVLDPVYLFRRSQRIGNTASEQSALFRDVLNRFGMTEDEAVTYVDTERWQRGLGLGPGHAGPPPEAVPDVKGPKLALMGQQPGDNKMYGPLQGYYVPGETGDILRWNFDRANAGTLGRVSETMRNLPIVNRGTQIWKGFQTIWRPAAHARNQMSDTWAAWERAGIDPITFGRYQGEAALALRNNEPWVREAFHNVPSLSDTFVQREVVNSWEKPWESNALSRLGATFNRAEESAAGVYNLGEQTRKLALVKWMLDKGSSWDAIGPAVEDTLLSYGKAPKWAHASASVLPFVRFMSLSPAKSVKGVLNAPWREAMLPRAISNFENAAGGAQTINEEQVSLPRYMRYGLFARVPGGEAESRYLNLTPTMPWYPGAMSASGHGVTDVAKVGAGMLHPALGWLYTMSTGTNPVTGREVITSNDPRPLGERTKQMLEATGQTFLPSWMPGVGYVSDDFMKAMRGEKDRTGTPYGWGDFIGGNIFGVRSTNVNQPMLEESEGIRRTVAVNEYKKNVYRLGREIERGRYPGVDLNTFSDIANGDPAKMDRKQLAVYQEAQRLRNELKLSLGYDPQAGVPPLYGTYVP